MKLANIKHHWPDIKPKLEELCARYDERWIPEDVYAACVYHEASLYVADEGFIVVTCGTDDIGRYMLVWIAYGMGTHLIEKYQANVDAIAKELGFDRIVMKSSRKGWHRVEGWRSIHTTYERVL